MPATFVLSIILSIVLYIVNPVFGWLIAGIGGSYFISASLVSAKNALKEGWEYLPILPLIFSTLHFSYGIGFLEGIISMYFFDSFGK